MGDVPVPVLTLSLPRSANCHAEDATEWLADVAPFCVKSLMSGLPRQHLFSAQHFRRLSGKELSMVSDHNIRLCDDFGDAFPHVKLLQTVRRLPAGPLPPALETLGICCGACKQPPDLSAVLPPLTKLRVGPQQVATP